MMTGLRSALERESALTDALLEARMNIDPKTLAELNKRIAELQAREALAADQLRLLGVSLHGARHNMNALAERMAESGIESEETMDAAEDVLGEIDRALGQWKALTGGEK